MKLKRILIAAATSAALTMPIVASATNGYFSHGYGTKNKGMAGAGVALPQDAMATATNPAGMVWVGDRMDLGAALFSPRRSYSESNTTTGMAGGFVVATRDQNSDSNYFLIPHFARNWMLSGDRSFGIAVYGNGGMNTDYAYPGPWPAAAPSGVNLMQLFIAPTFSMKIDSKSSWGVAPILAFQAFEARGLSAFSSYSADSANLTDRQHDKSYGMGIRIGYQGEVSPGVTFGISATSKIYMSKFKNYAGLFAEGGDFDIPANVTVGLAWKTSPTSVMTADVQHIWYSKVASVGNSVTLLSGCPALGGSNSNNCFGASNGPGFGWDDMTILKLGYQWQGTGGWTWRAGISYGKQPISETTLNILAPAVMQTHLTFGFTKKTGKTSELNFAAMYAPKVKKTAASALGFNDNITLEMSQFELEASWGWTF
jgi:long-chain fatty acid transport protein